MKEAHQWKCKFVVTGESPRIAEIGRILGKRPNSSVVKGQLAPSGRIAISSGWTLSMVGELNVTLPRLLRALESNWSALSSFMRKERLRATIGFVVFTNAVNVETVVSHRILRRFAALKIDMGIDIYCVDFAPTSKNVMWKQPRDYYR